MNPIIKPLVKERIETDEAPDAVGPYSQAVAADRLVFVSGQLGIIPGTKKLAGPGIEEQTRQAMENIAAILERAGSSLDQVVKTTIYLSDMDNFGPANETYGRFFPRDPPARATLQAAALPLGALIEIDAVAIRD